MCGIIGVIGRGPVNQLLYDGLLLLQHRGQDAAGIATASQGSHFNMFKAHGLVRDVFRTRNMRSLPGTTGIGHVRYPTAGSSVSEEEAQPFYVNAPYGITFAHNGNLTNWRELRESLYRVDRRHINTDSDSEVLLNVLAHELQVAAKGMSLDDDTIFQAVVGLHKRARGAYAVVSQISGYGMLAFRDPYGIRPLCIGRQETEEGVEWMVASESVALEGSGFAFFRDVEPGEAIFVDLDGRMVSRQCADNPELVPCIFEYVYFARPDSMINGVSVYDARLRMGEYLADKVARNMRLGDIDVVMPIPDSSRPAAMQLAARLNLDYREGLIKNRYVGRTFIMPGQAVRRKSVRQKLNAIGSEFKGKNVLLVDDSIVRGTTSREIVDMARAAGANKVYFASAAPPVRFPNVYGIDMPTQSELIATGRSDEEIAATIGADGLIYQDLADMERSVSDINPALKRFESSCFNGDYVTGDITPEYLERLSLARSNADDEESTGGLQFNMGHGLND
ncbi:amidophosphoribosyltransferase [Bordetella tumulicola]|uniref:amidophosphoribosyltransferase n=1 Tax=Bordetella tumulicola TaxID=1649133 RepID=UPI0039EF9E90